MAQRGGAPVGRREEVPVHDYDWATRANSEFSDLTHELAGLTRREAELTSPRHGPPNAAEREELRGIRERFPELTERRDALFEELRLHIGEAIAATTDPARLSELNRIKSHLDELAGAMGMAVTPARVEAPPGMVRVGEELLTREEYDAMEEQVRRALSLEGIAASEGEVAMRVAETRRAPLLTPELSEDTTTVRRWWAKLTSLGEENSENVDRLGRLLGKLAEYQQKLAVAQEEGNTRRANYYKGKIEDLQEDIAALREKIDRNMVEQAQMLTNVINSLPGALEAARAEPSRRTREDHVRRLEAIQREWEDMQEKIRKALALETILGAPSPEIVSAFATAREYSIRPLDEVFAEAMRREEAERAAARPPAVPTPAVAPLAVVPAPPPPVTAAVPVVVPVGATYFEYLNEHTGRRYRISIDGEDLSRMGVDGVYARVQEYTGTAANFRHLHVQRIDERGNVDYTYESRNHVRDRFFREQLGWVPAAVPAAPAVVPAPPAAPPRFAGPVGAPPPREALRVPEPMPEEYIAMARRYNLTDTGQARSLLRFQRGEGSLSVDVRDFEHANTIYNLALAEGRRRGTIDTSLFGIIEPSAAGQPYTVFYRPLSPLELLQKQAAETNNPFGLLNYGARFPLGQERNGYTLDAFAGVLPAYNAAHPDMPATFTGFGDADMVAADPESQALAYVADSARRLTHWRFTTRENGLDVASRLIYPGGRGYGLETTPAGEPVLSLEENAAWAAAFWTADAGRVMVTLQGEENVEGIDVNIFSANINAARRGNDNADDPKYRGRAPSRLREFYDPEHPERLEEALAALPPEIRASIDVAAEFRGQLMYQERARRLGEPENPEAVLAACVNAARMQIVAKSYAEVGRDVAFGRFTWGEREYPVGTNFITRADWEGLELRGFEDSSLDGKKFADLLFVPTATAGVVQVVGVVSGGEVQMLRADAEPQLYLLDWRDSVGLAGLTRRWSYNLPMIDIGAANPFTKTYEDIIAPPYVGLGAGYEDIVPPRIAGRNLEMAYAEPALSGVFEHYSRGEDLDESYYTISNPVLRRRNPATGDFEAAGAMPLEEMLDSRNTYVELAMFRVPVPGQDRFYATLTPEAKEKYGGMLQNPDEMVHTAELRDGNIYVYVDTATGRIVDALDPRLREAQGEVRSILMGTYSFTRDEEGIVRDYTIFMREEAKAELAALGITLGPLDDGRGLVMAQIPGRRILEMVHAGELEISGNSLEMRMRVADQVVSKVGTNPEIYPESEGYLAVGRVNAFPIYVPVEAEAAGAYNYDAMAERSRRLAELHEEFARVADSAKTTESAEEERRAEGRLAEIAIERRQIMEQMLAELDSALPAYVGDDRRRLEEFRDALQRNMGPDLGSLRAWRASIEEETYYSRAYLLSQWKQLEGVHAQFDGLRAQYEEAERRGDEAEMGRIMDQGWLLLLQRRELYENMLRHMDTSTVVTPSARDALNVYRAEIERNFGQYFGDVDFAALRAEFGR
ncbi:MAG: hypothetical protein AB1657_01505 [Candidatus Micrarchaeota archaeon]